MRGGRRKLPVLAEISGPAPGETRAWSLRRADLEALSELQEGLDDHHNLLVAGDEGLTGAIALASAASAAGRRTVLLECDLERPRLALELGLSPGPGLHEYLRWEASAAEILQPLVLAGPAARAAADPLVCVVAGRPAADAATLLGLESFRHALAKLRAAYELVVVSGPPLESGDGPLTAVAARADTLLAAVSPAAVSGRRAGRESRARLRRLPVPTRGAILVGEA
jgi:succinoglycan biosynthesis transport protein ExoP